MAMKSVVWRIITLDMIEKGPRFVKQTKNGFNPKLVFPIDNFAICGRIERIIPTVSRQPTTVENIDFGPKKAV
jgi:hypothetical protein